MFRAKGRSGKSTDGKGSARDAGVQMGDSASAVPEMSDSETESADEEGSDDGDDDEELLDDGLSSDSSDSGSRDGEDDEESDNALLFESTEETEYLAEDANDRVAPLAKDHARRRRESRRTSAGSESSSVSVNAGRRPKRQESTNSTSSNDAWTSGPVVGAGTGTKTPSSILQDASGTTSSSPDLGPRPGQETSVRIVSPSTASSSPHPSQGYFDAVPAPMPPAAASVARRRLFKKSSRDDYGTQGTPGGLLTPGGAVSGTATPGSISGLATPTSRKRRPVFKRGKGKKGTEYTLDHPSQQDVLGIVMLEIEGAVDLPKLRNCTSPANGWGTAETDISVGAQLSESRLTWIHLS